MDIEKFNKWNENKKLIQNKVNTNFYIKNREVWFTKIGINIGFEENGKDEFRRPVLVLKKIGNLFFIVPLTSKGKVNNKFYHKFKTAKFNKNNLKYKNSSFCILSQAKVMDKKRFTEKMGYIGKEEFFNIKEKLKELLL